MAQFAPVCPIPMARNLKKEGLLGNYHLLLAHDVLARPKDYEELYKDDNFFVIMDNSVIELEEPLDAEKIAEAANIVDANVTVLPDFLLDKDRTIEVSNEAVSLYTNAGLKNFMAVPQGKTEEEVIECADKLAGLPGVNHWGIGRFITEDISGTRTNVLADIRQRYPHYGIHLLGFSDDLADDIFCSLHPSISGIDSAVPMRCGLHDIPLTVEMQGHPPRGDFWETANELNDLVRNNINWFRRIIA